MTDGTKQSVRTQKQSPLDIYAGRVSLLGELDIEGTQRGRDMQISSGTDETPEDRHRRYEGQRASQRDRKRKSNGLTSGPKI